MIDHYPSAVTRRELLIGVGSATVASAITAVSLAALNSPLRTSAVNSSQYTFYDDFDGPAGSAPDIYKWSFATGPGSAVAGNGESETYAESPANAYLDGNSNLVIAVTSTAASAYDSARLSTKGNFSQLYGSWEARIAVENTPGCWPAFWFLGENGTWPQCGEVDVMENYGTGFTTGTIWNGTASSKVAQRSAATDTAFHVYRMEWERGKIALYRDGQLFAAATAETLAPWPFDTNGGMYAILDVATGGSGTGYTAPARASLPARMIVDYVRCWR